MPKQGACRQHHKSQAHVTEALHPPIAAALPRDLRANAIPVRIDAKTRMPASLARELSVRVRLEDAVCRYLAVLAARSYALSTIRSRRSALGRFLRWAANAGLTCPDDVGPNDLEAFQTDLAGALRADGRPLGWASQGEVLMAVKRFFQWCAKTRILSADPALDLAVPRRPARLPRSVLSSAEVEIVLAQANCGDPLGLRDRALMELLYSTGLRRTECTQLLLADVDCTRGVVLVREGKGRRDRVVPIGARALRWLDLYLFEARPQLAAEPDVKLLFLTRRGRPVRANRLSELIHGYIQAASIGKSGSCHVFRHTMATLLLEGGADIRHIQAMLGHVHLSTTALYTRVSVAQLKQVHARAHPAERGEGAGRSPEQVELEFDLVDPA